VFGRGVSRKGTNIWLVIESGEERLLWAGSTEVGSGGKRALTKGVQ